MTRQLVITEDGSSSIFIAELNEHFHSIHGAIQESKHIYIEAGLNQKINKQKNIDVLEVGFGTGLNALLTCMEGESRQQNIQYTSIEKYPLESSLYPQLNFCTILDNPHCTSIFNKIFSSEWEKSNVISEFFSLLKLRVDIEESVFRNQFDIIYFDAFAPAVQPELWTASVFKAMFMALKPNGFLVTYCAKGEVKRTLTEVGFRIESLPGPKGKREMTRAIK